MSGKIKTDPYHPSPLSNDVKDEKVKNDNRKKTEQKIKVVKNVSTVSLPNYNELVKPVGKVSSDVENSDDKTGNQSGGLKPPRRNSSAISLPGEGSNSIITSLSEATIHRLEAYMKRCRSFGSLKPQQLIEKLEEFQKKSYRSASESSDSWSGLDDWDLGVIEYCDPETTSVPPLLPKSTLPPKVERKVGKQENVPLFSIGSTEIHRSQTPSNESDENSKMLPEVTNKKEEEESPRNISEPADKVPVDWFENEVEIDKILDETNTPPPTPENKHLEDSESKENAKDESEKSKTPEPDSIPVPPRRKSREDEGRKRKRSHSLNPDKLQNLLNLDIYKSRAPTVSLQRATSLIEELAKNPEEIEKELRSDPKKVIDGLEKQCLYQSLPEDAFEIFLTRKKPSLRESLSEFLGFEPEKLPKSDLVSEKPSLPQDKSEKVITTSVMDEIDLDRKTPPPLPSSPPPMLDTPPAELEVVLTSPNPLVKHSDQNPDNM